MARTNQKHRNSRAAVAAAPAPIDEPAPKTFYEAHQATQEQRAAWFRSELLAGISESDQAHLGTCLRILNNSGGFAPLRDFFTSLLLSVERGDEITPDLVAEKLDQTLRYLFNTAAEDIPLFAFSNPSLCRELMEKGEQERRDLHMEVAAGKSSKRKEDE